MCCKWRRRSGLLTIWEGIVLGAVQGLTEFLPVSSSGHLVLAKTWLGLETPGVVVEALLHLGTLLAVLLFYWRDLAAVIGGFVSGHVAWLQRRVTWRTLWQSPDVRLGYLLIIGSVPAAVAGLLIQPIIDRLFQSTLQVGFGLLVTALLLWAAGRMAAGNRRIAEANASDALFVGAAQAVAIMPGISRSGATVVAALGRGIDRALAVRFSFLLSIPAIVGAQLLELKHIAGAGSELGLGLWLGMLSAFVSGYAAIAWFTRLVARGRFTGFVVYCGVLGLIVIALSLR